LVIIRHAVTHIFADAFVRALIIFRAASGMRLSRLLTIIAAPFSRAGIAAQPRRPAFRRTDTCPFIFTAITPVRTVLAAALIYAALISALLVATTLVATALISTILRTATLITVFNDDTTTAGQKSTVSDDGTTYDREEFVSGA